MVMSADLDYKTGKLADGTDAEGALTAEAAKPVRCNTWQGSNAEAVIKPRKPTVFHCRNPLGEQDKGFPSAMPTVKP